jgi:hypothetical protein
MVIGSLILSVTIFSRRNFRMKVGDHLVVDQGGYKHHGIYVGGKDVIHYTGVGSKLGGMIDITTVEQFSDGKLVKVVEHWPRVYDAAESVYRANSRIGENRYNLLWNNCEHFVLWCIQGVPVSHQVNKVVGAAVVAGRILSVAKSAETVSTVASAAGGAIGSGTGVASSGLAAGLTAVGSTSLLPVIGVAVACGAAGYCAVKLVQWLWGD